MKKLLFALLIVALTASFSYAEQSAQTYSGNATQNYREQQVFIDCYNNSGSAISSNYVVILDTTAASVASGSYLGTYITTTTTPADTRVLGVTDATIPAASVGRVCIRGPHKVYLTSAPSAVGATVATTSTAGAGVPWSASLPGNSSFGFALSSTVIGNGFYVGVPVNKTVSSSDGMTNGDGTSNYWVWITGPSSK